MVALLPRQYLSLRNRYEVMETIGEWIIVQEKPAEWPDLEHYADVPLFNTKAVVQQTGIAAPTLRAWERRYMILSPQRAQNDYRLYSERDIAIIGWLKDRVDAGMSISQAIALFRHLQEEHNQLRRESLRSERASPSQEVVTTAAVDTHETIAENDWQEQDETFNMRLVRERLLDAFNRLDEAAASRLMASMLAVYPIEQVCIELITPTLWEIGQLWEQGLITVSIEHFASSFFHGWLSNLLHAMPTRHTDPLVIACCAPGELHELAPLMLSLLLRRAGLRVAYLGQSIETEGLLQTVRQLSPALICVSVTSNSCLETATGLGQRVQELPPPRPVLVFGGQAFEQGADLIARVPGIYLAGDMQSIITQLRRMALQQAEEQR
jgi:MerR family transcriptional regulator, light-induced transcriptional regulator